MPVPAKPAKPARPEPESEPPAPFSAARPTDAVLVVAARAGEGWAREALFRRHAQLCTGLAYRLLGNDMELEDVVQEAYYVAFTSLHRIDDPQAFASWLSCIVVRCVRRVIRRRKLLQRLGLRDPLPLDSALPLASGTPPDVAAELRELYVHLDALPTEARLVFVLHRVEGYSLPAIAGQLGRSLSTVKRRFGEAETALARLRGGEEA
jgi:RNA polymerase sigma-70 factor (ECF subfamily)